MLKRLWCLLLWHDVRVIQEFTPEQRKLRCERCGRYFGMHDGAKAFVPWDGELERMYRENYDVSRTNL